MKILRFLFLLIFLISHSQEALKTDSGFQITTGKKVQIKFQFINNLILIPINVNGVELTFLLDSGVNETILFSLENKNVDLKNLSKVRFSGLGENNDVEGLESVHNDLRLAGNGYEDQDHTIFIILNQDVGLSEHLGVPVNGIIGYAFFKNYPMLIDFVKKKITIYPHAPKISRRYEAFPISIEAHKPYIWADVQLTRKKEHSKLLVDLGNSDAIWLFPYVAEKYINEHPFIEDYLGSGFNGDIMGKRGRIHQFSLGPFILDKPLVVVPDSISIRNLRVVSERKGSLGNEILRRFKLLLNYRANMLYLKKDKNFNDPFLFNKSGIEIKQQGFVWEEDLVPVDTKTKEPSTPKNGQAIRITPTLFQYKFVLKPSFVISNCRAQSPCDTAGLAKGDQLISINGKKVSNFSLSKINKILTEGNDGTVVTIEVQRDQKILKTTITLEDPIPYRDTADHQ